jgi:mannose-1-phosphate guanylyltransferase
MHICMKALWYCGVFAFKLGFLISIFLEKGLPFHYEELSREYHMLRKINFDYKVVERVRDIVPFSYIDIEKILVYGIHTEEMVTTQIGKGV